MEGLSERLRREADNIWRRIIEHPFVLELYRGSLPLEKFRYYVIQDYNYLIGMMRAYSILASKADYELARVALEIAYLDATTEMENYRRLLERLGLRLGEVMRVEPSPTNMAYMNYLLATALFGEPMECLVATLPCFWSYLEIGERHRDLLRGNPNELYRSWAEVYITEEYKGLVRRLREIIDGLWEGEDYDRYRRIFNISSRYEWMFWEMAYKLESWPI
ncbi:thiaminase II [Candidatus Bathyarchaeota archaeon]|nr:thiaminase II [Candidatus Bathyarchaeota archaeon]